MCLAHESLRTATNKYGALRYHTLYRFLRNAGNVGSRQRCSQTSSLSRVPVINDNQQRAYIIPLLSTSTHTRRKVGWIRKREAVFWNWLECEEQSGKAIKDFSSDMNVEFDFYGKKGHSPNKNKTYKSSTDCTFGGGETDAAVLLSPSFLKY